MLQGKTILLGILDAFESTRNQSRPLEVSFFAREKFFDSIRILKENKLMDAELRQLSESLVSQMSFCEERGPNNRAANYAMGALAAARLFPKHKDAKLWKAYAEAVWNDWYEPGDSYEPAYVAHNIPRLIALGVKLGKQKELKGDKLKQVYYKFRNHVSSSICVINSCSVTEHADKKCRNLIRKLHRRNPGAIIAVTGCYAQLKPQEIAAIEGVDIVLSNNDKGMLYKRVVELSGKGRAQIYSCDTESLTSFFAAFSSGDRTRAFLKVQDGCDYKCAYCTIHYARGGSRNMPIADLVAEARQIAAAGQKEIVITGINTGDFGRTTGERFIDLLRALNEVEGIERYRISSIEPNLLTAIRN